MSTYSSTYSNNFVTQSVIYYFKILKTLILRKLSYIINCLSACDYQDHIIGGEYVYGSKRICMSYCNYIT